MKLQVGKHYRTVAGTATCMGYDASKNTYLVRHYDAIGPFRYGHLEDGRCEHQPIRTILSELTQDEMAEHENNVNIHMYGEAEELMERSRRLSQDYTYEELLREAMRRRVGGQSAGPSHWLPGLADDAIDLIQARWAEIDRSFDREGMEPGADLLEARRRLISALGSIADLTDTNP